MIREIEEIKTLYSQIKRKSDFIQHIADLIGRNNVYVRCHYFSSFWKIPEKYRKTIIKELNKWEKK